MGTYICQQTFIEAKMKGFRWQYFTWQLVYNQGVHGYTEITYPVAFSRFCYPVFVHIGNDAGVNIIESYNSNLTTLKLHFNYQTSNEFRAIIIGI